MKKIALIFFLLFVIVACILATVAKMKEVKNERAWKDNMMSMQITALTDNQAEHEEMKQDLSILSSTGMTSQQVREVVDNEVSLMYVRLYDDLSSRFVVESPAYQPTAYCVSQIEGDRIRLDCRNFP